MSVGTASDTRPPGRADSAWPTCRGSAFAARRTRLLLVVLPALTLAVAAALAAAPRDQPGAPGRASGWRRARGRRRRLVEHARLVGDLIAESLLALARDPAQKAGLVLASDSAYVALPPEAPGSALRGWQRLISVVSASNRKIAASAKQDRTPIPYPTPGRLPVGRCLHRRHAALRPGSRAPRGRCGESGAAERADRPDQRPARRARRPPARERRDHPHARARHAAARRRGRQRPAGP